jgi:hypothetical protein
MNLIVNEINPHTTFGDIKVNRPFIVAQDELYTIGFKIDPVGQYNSIFIDDNNVVWATVPDDTEVCAITIDELEVTKL